MIGGLKSGKRYMIGGPKSGKRYMIGGHNLEKKWQKKVATKYFKKNGKSGKSDESGKVKWQK